MQRRATNLSNRRVLAAALAVAGAASVWADAIQFSKPAVEIAAPNKAPDLPEQKSKAIEFGSNPSMERPIMTPPPMVRIPPPPREREDDDDTKRHPLLREPKSFSDTVTRPDGRNSLSSSKNQNPQSTPWARANGNKSFDAQHALAPITDLNWDPREGEQRRRNESSSPNRSETSDRKDGRTRDLYGVREDDSTQKSPFDPPPAPDPFSFRPRENSTASQMERRAAFEQLFNSGAPVARPPGSLEPVAGLDTIKPTAPIAMPMLAGPKLELAPTEAPNAFKAQQERLQAPASDEFSKRFSQPPKPAVAPVESRFQNSLMRQPTVHDIPTRKGL